MVEHGASLGKQSRHVSWIWMGREDGCSVLEACVLSFGGILSYAGTKVL